MNDGADKDNLEGPSREIENDGRSATSGAWRSWRRVFRLSRSCCLHARRSSLVMESKFGGGDIGAWDWSSVSLIPGFLPEWVSWMRWIHGRFSEEQMSGIRKERRSESSIDIWHPYRGWTHNCQEISHQQTRDEVTNVIRRKRRSGRRHNCRRWSSFLWLSAMELRAPPEIRSLSSTNPYDNPLRRSAFKRDEGDIRLFLPPVLMWHLMTCLDAAISRFESFEIQRAQLLTTSFANQRNCQPARAPLSASCILARYMSDALPGQAARKRRTWLDNRWQNGATANLKVTCSRYS